MKINPFLYAVHSQMSLRFTFHRLCRHLVLLIRCYFLYNVLFVLMSRSIQILSIRKFLFAIRIVFSTCLEIFSFLVCTLEIFTVMVIKSRGFSWSGFKNYRDPQSCPKKQSFTTLNHSPLKWHWYLIFFTIKRKGDKRWSLYLHPT